MSCELGVIDSYHSSSVNWNNQVLAVIRNFRAAGVNRLMQPKHSITNHVISNKRTNDDIAAFFYVYGEPSGCYLVECELAHNLISKVEQVTKSDRWILPEMPGAMFLFVQRNRRRDYFVACRREVYQVVGWAFLKDGFQLFHDDIKQYLARVRMIKPKSSVDLFQISGYDVQMFVKDKRSYAGHGLLYFVRLLAVKPQCVIHQ
jgi:hypothetical protein